MSDQNRRPGREAESDDGMDALLRDCFHERRAQTAVPDFDGMLRRVEAEARSRRAAVLDLDHSPVAAGVWWRWLSLPGALIGVAALTLVAVVGLLSRSEVASPEADPLLLAQLEQTTLWVAPSDRWLRPAVSPIPLGLPDFSTMQFHMTETLTWSHLDG